jgi:hypothetical protein
MEYAVRVLEKGFAAVDVPVEWTGSSGHVLHQPWFSEWLRDDLAELIIELEQAAPEGLDSRRIAFKKQGQIEKGSRTFKQLSLLQRQAQASDQLLDERVELLVGAQLLRAGVLMRMRKETPDFDCQWGGFEFGVEVTARARREVGAALHEVLERGLWDGPGVSMTLMRSGELLFSKDPTVIAGIASRVIAEVKKRSDRTLVLSLPCSVPVPELGLTAVLLPDTGLSRPGIRVTYESLLTPDDWEHHWTTAADISRTRSRRIRASRPTHCQASSSWMYPGWAKPARCLLTCGPASSRVCWTPASWAILAGCSSCARL